MELYGVLLIRMLIENEPPGIPARSGFKSPLKSPDTIEGAVAGRMKFSEGVARHCPKDASVSKRCGRIESEVTRFLLRLVKARTPTGRRLRESVAALLGTLLETYSKPTKAG